jgi:hypothetical protein
MNLRVLLPVAILIGCSPLLQAADPVVSNLTATIWLKPYRTLLSRIGGVISFHDSGMVPQNGLSRATMGLTWFRAADVSGLSYPSGFAALHAAVGVRGYSAPSSAGSLAKGLGLTQQTFRNVLFDGVGLPDKAATIILPQAFALDSSSKLKALLLPGKVVAPWIGPLNAKTGGFTGTLEVAASSSGFLAGNARCQRSALPRLRCRPDSGRRAGENTHQWSFRSLSNRSRPDVQVAGDRGFPRQVDDLYKNPKKGLPATIVPFPILCLILTYQIP